MTSVTVTTGQWPAREFRIGGHGRVIINYVPTLHLIVYHLSIVPVAHISDDKFSRQRAHTNYLLRLRGLTRHVQIYIIYTKKKKFKKTIYPLSSPPPIAYAIDYFTTSAKYNGGTRRFLLMTLLFFFFFFAYPIFPLKLL